MTTPSIGLPDSSCEDILITKMFQDFSNQSFTTHYIIPKHQQKASIARIRSNSITAGSLRCEQLAKCELA
jgi:hypothetical protein